MSLALTGVTPCVTHDAAIGCLPNTIVSSAAMSVSAASDTGPYMTIAITNSYGAQLSLSFGLDAGYPSPLGDPLPTILPPSFSTQYVYPTGWAGNIGVGPILSPKCSKIEGSFTGPPDIDVSYVDGYSVPITCSSQGKTVTGCNIDLFQQLATCEDQIEGPVCLNSAVNISEGPPPCFFAPCAGAAYTFPHDNHADAGDLGSNLVSCCIGTSCEAPPWQLQNNTINCQG